VNEILPFREYVTGYREGRYTILVDRERAAKFMSRRMMLPLVLLPFFGTAVALALVGKWLAAGLVFFLGIGLRFLVRRTSADFVMQRSLQEEKFYFDAARAEVVKVQARSEDAPG
jgi:hypothetical protein